MEFIQQLSGLALIVPVIAKADTMTMKEHTAYLHVVRDNLQLLQERTNHAVIYDFEEGDSTIFLPVEVPLECPVVDEQAAADAEVEASFHPDASQMTDAEFNVDVNYNIETDGGAHENVYSTYSETEENYIGYADVVAGLHSHHFTARAPTVTSETANDDHETETKSGVKTTLPRIPNVFAVVCDLSENGLREYQYGTLEINNKEHSDFRRLQELVFEQGTHLIKMKELTEKMSIRLYAESQKKSDLLVKAYPIYEKAKGWIDMFVLWIVYSLLGLYAVRQVGMFLLKN